MSTPSSLLATIQLQTDFVVIGGGMSGVCAALAAARNGLKVVLIQDRSVLGGNASSEIKMHIVGADCHGMRPGSRESGIIEELRLEDATRNPHRSYSQWDLLLYEKVKAEPNITLFLDTTCTGCTTDPETHEILSVSALRNSTEDQFVITAKFFADCSGDSRLGAEAGADFTVGRESKAEYNEPLALDVADKKTLGSSILMTAREHATPQPYRSPSWARTFKKEQLTYRGIGNSYEYGYWWFEWGGQLDTLKNNETIRHEGLRIALGAWDYIKNSGEHANSTNWALEWVGAIPGKRESRRLLGPHVLTQGDVQEGTIFPDAVAYGGWAIDLHPPQGVDAPELRPCYQYYQDWIYTIPFRVLHSRNIPNLLFAGRNISATHVAFASTRVMATCAVMGQAIGTAAALAVEKGLTLDQVGEGDAMRALQQRLVKDDAFLPTVPNADTDDKARTAKAITASSSLEEREPGLVIDGITRDLIGKFGKWADGKVHRWESKELPAWLEIEFAEAVEISEVHLTFDSGFERELMLSLSDYMSRKLIRGAQPELVREYRILAGDMVLVTEADNYLRKRIHKLDKPVRAESLKIEITGTWGVTTARLFEVRVY